MQFRGAQLSDQTRVLQRLLRDLVLVGDAKKRKTPCSVRPASYFCRHHLLRLNADIIRQSDAISVVWAGIFASTIERSGKCRLRRKGTHVSQNTVARLLAQLVRTRGMKR